MKKKFTFLAALLISSVISFTQVWQQTASSPEGAGVTEIVVDPNNNYIYVTTASFNWPNGEDGGVRRSTNDGMSWTNLYDAYSGRTITLAADGNLYASIWPYPQGEGLYRSGDNGDTWQLLVLVLSGNNIFSVTVSTVTNPNTIFAGTRQGVYRSIDNGSTWAYSNSGIPANSWARDIEVDSAGIVVAATHGGLFSSENNGDDWQEVTGGGIENDTIVKILFDYPFSKDGNTRLLSGSNNGNIYESFADTKYLTATLLTIFGSNELSGMAECYLASENKKMHGVSRFPKGTQPGGFNLSTDQGITWEPYTGGLPGPTFEMSALSGISTSQYVHFYSGMFQNMNGGAKVFKITFNWSIIIGLKYPAQNNVNNLQLFQNFPNPFSHNTSISFYLEEAAQVKLKVYASDGHLVRTLLESKQTKGEHQLTINAGDLEEGIYFYQLDVEGLTEVRKMVVLK